MYRRDPRVRRPVARLCRPVRGGVRVLAPEAVLLYKAKAPRPADEQDFVSARPLLDAEARAWLAAALIRQDVGHAWAAALASEA